MAGKLKKAGDGARDLNAILRFGKNALKFWDDVKDRASSGVGPTQKVARIRRDFAAFRLRVVTGLFKKGWSEEEIADLLGTSTKSIEKTKKALDKIEKVLGPKIVDIALDGSEEDDQPEVVTEEEDEEDVPF